MQTIDLSLLPTAIDITLYRYNYIDNKLWTQIQNDVDFILNEDGSIIVSIDQIKYILDKYYIDHVNKIKTLGSEVIYKEINSVYFLYQITIEMSNLQYIKFNLNFDKSYNRTIESGGNKILQFSFKILTATIRLSDFWDDEELPIVNEALEKIGVLLPGKQYNRMLAKDITSSIDNLLVEMENEDDHQYLPIADLLDILEPKLEPENSLILLITDY